MPTLAELRAQSGPKPLPRASKTVTLIEGQHLLAESERLSEEAGDLNREEARLKQEASRANAEGERSGPPRKSGEGAATVRRLEEIAARLAEIAARQDEALDEMAKVQGDVGLTGYTGGDWQRFKEENPPREDNANDRRFTAGHCDSAALFGILGKFVTSWDGEPVTEKDWNDWLAERITYADRRDLVPAIVNMHEGKAARSPKSRNGSATTSPSESD